MLKIHHLLFFCFLLFSFDLLHILGYRKVSENVSCVCSLETLIQAKVHRNESLISGTQSPSLCTHHVQDCKNYIYTDTLVFFMKHVVLCILVPICD